MQRTVYSTKFTYVHNEVMADNTIKSEVREITIHETDEKKALRKAHKKVGYFSPIKTEKVSELYVLDDEIFFKYAQIKTDADTTSENQ